MKSVSIKRSLVIGIVAVMAFFVIQAIAVLTIGRYTERNVVSVARQNTVAQVSLAELSTLAQQVRRYEKEYFIFVDNAEKRAQYKKEWTASMEKITRLLGIIRTNSEGAFSSTDLEESAKWWAASDFYAKEMDKVFAHVDTAAARVEENSELLKKRAEAAALSKIKVPAAAEGSVEIARMITPAEANDLIKAGKDRFSAELIKSVTTTFAAKSQSTLELTGVTNEGFNQMIYGVMATVFIGLAICAYLIVTLPKRITQPIDDITKRVEAISKGSPPPSAQNVAVKEFNGLHAAVERMRVAQEFMLSRLKK